MGNAQDEREDDEDKARVPCRPRSSTAPRGFRKWLGIVLALFFVVGCFAGIANLYLEVRAGRGGELQRSMWGYKVSPIGILVTVGASLAALAAISFIEWLFARHYRALERKHRQKRP